VVAVAVPATAPKLKASDEAGNGQFGDSIALSKTATRRRSLALTLMGLILAGAG